MEPRKKAVVPLWLQQIFDNENKCRNPKKLLRNDGRKAVWAMCTLLGSSSLGIPGQTCRLFELYLTERFRTARPLLRSAEGKARLQEELSSQLSVLIAVCVQLATKSVCASTALNSKHTKICLAKQNIETTVSEINRMEAVVFKALDFKIPLYTSVDIAQLLATEIGLPMCTMKDIDLMTDLAEHHRDRVDARVQQMYMPSSDFNPSQVSTLHLAAGTVAAIGQHLPDYNVASAVSQLADLTKAPATYIDCILTVIFTYVLPLSGTSEDVPQKKQKLV